MGNETMGNYPHCGNLWLTFFRDVFPDPQHGQETFWGWWKPKDSLHTPSSGLCCLPAGFQIQGELLTGDTRTRTHTHTCVYWILNRSLSSAGWQVGKEVSEDILLRSPDHQCTVQSRAGWASSQTLPAGGAGCRRDWFREPRNCSLRVHVAGKRKRSVGFIAKNKIHSISHKVAVIQVYIILHISAALVKLFVMIRWLIGFKSNVLVRCSCKRNQKLILICSGLR